MKQCRLGGLDRFRPVAALLVVAIHTGPLLSWSRDVNYLLCDILAGWPFPFSSPSADISSCRSCGLGA